MKKVTIIDKVEKEFKSLPEKLMRNAQFESDEEMNAWIEACKATNAWGAPEDYTIVIEDINEEYNLSVLRESRNAILQSTDKYLLSDYPITAEELVDMKSYRAYLRDLPSQAPLADKVKTLEEFLS